MKHINQILFYSALVLVVGLVGFQIYQQQKTEQTAGQVYGAPVSNLFRNVLPETNQTYDLGSTTPALEWKNLYAKNVTVSGTCTGCGSGAAFAWTPTTNFNQSANSTTTQIWLRGSPFSLTASSTSVFSYASTTQLTVGSDYITDFSTGLSISAAGVVTADVPATRALTIAGTANQITSSAGAQDLSADRTWALSLPNHVIFPSSYVASLGTTTNATSTNMNITGQFDVDGLTSAIVLTGSGGVFAEYAGTSCTNQFVRSLDALGAAGCATVGTLDVSGLDISDDTNLAATWPVILTGDTLSFGGLSTSTAPTTGQLPYWTGVNTFGSVATGTVSAGTGITISSTIYALLNAASIAIDLAANLVWTGAHDFGGATSLEIPNSASPTVNATGEIALDTTTGQFAFYDGIADQRISATTTKSFNIASTTLDAMGNKFNTATSTFSLMNSPEPLTLLGFYCMASTTGTALVRLGDGVNWTTEQSCSSGAYTLTSSNNTFTAFESMMVQASSTAGTVSRITVTAVLKQTAQ